jgi:ribonuclease Z
MTALTRRDALKLSGMTLGGLAAAEAARGGRAHEALSCPSGLKCYEPGYPPEATQQYSYMNDLPEIQMWGYDANGNVVGEKLHRDEMRITFMGSNIPPVRRAAQEMSLFVEVGWDEDAERPLDQLVFDCGSGVCANYASAGVGYGRMDKVFISHLHGDHMSDLTHIYCFGPSADRWSPLYVWGPGPSGVRSPRPPRRLYDDGTRAFCEHLRAACRWHTESFSFQRTSYPGYDRPTQESWGLPCRPVPVGDDPPDDGFALVPIELDWTKYGRAADDNVAYRRNGVKVTHFPVIHTRRGSIGYMLEWTTEEGRTLSMIYTSDTKPEKHCVAKAINGGKGVDVFVHEMVVPPEVWAYKNMGLQAPPPDSPAWQAYLNDLQRVQASSHTPQGAFAYLLSEISKVKRPRMTVATHFNVADDTVACALKSIRQRVPDIAWDKAYDPDHKNIVWSFDMMVLRVFPDTIQQCKARANDFSFSPPIRTLEEYDDPKYAEPDDQIDTTMAIDPGPDTYCSDGY